MTALWCSLATARQAIFLQNILWEICSKLDFKHIQKKSKSNPFSLFVLSLSLKIKKSERCRRWRCFVFASWWMARLSEERREYPILALFIIRQNDVPVYDDEESNWNDSTLYFYNHIAPEKYCIEKKKLLACLHV